MHTEHSKVTCALSLTLTLIALLLLGGCDLWPRDNPSDEHCNAGSCDAGAPDSAADLVKPDAPADAGTPDIAPDVPVPDLTVPDLKVPDAPVPDVPVPDVAVPDLAVPDLPAPDLPLPDQALPDQALPDLALPDLASPDQNLPDQKVPADTMPPDTKCGGCIIAGTCIAPMAINKANKCQRCEPKKSLSAWTHFSASGCVTTLVGTGTAGCPVNNAPLLNAKLNAPYYLALNRDDKDKIYVAPANCKKVFEIAAGVIKVVPGSPSLAWQRGVAVSSSGTVFVSDHVTGTVHKIANGSASQVASGFNSARGMVVSPSGDLYVAETWGCRIWRIKPGKAKELIAGNGTCVPKNDSVGSKAQFKYPVGLALDGFTLYVGDSTAIRKIDLNPTKNFATSDHVTKVASSAESMGPFRLG